MGTLSRLYHRLFIMKIMPALLIIFPLLISTAMSQDMLNSILFQVSDVDDAGMIFAGSLAAKVCGNKDCCFTHWTSGSVDQGEEIFLSGSSQLGECNKYDINDDQELEISMTIYHQGFDAVRLDFVNVTVVNGAFETVQCDINDWLNNGEYISANDCY